MNEYISINSSREGCPETWTFLSLSVIISTPFSRNLFCTLEIAFSLPGICLLEKITVSPLVKLIYLSKSLEILESAELGSPCEPVQIIRRLDLGIKFISLKETRSGIFVK